jgi:hypothetical protein
MICRAGGTGGGFGGGSAVPIGLTGKMMSVPFELSLPVGCNGMVPTVSRVDVAVLDPSNKSVPATTTAVATASDGQPTVTVSFTPQTPGPYHFNVRFEPGLGTVQKDAVVAVDKTQATPNIVGIPTSPQVSCQQIDVDGDTLLCLDFTQGLLTIRAAQVVDQVQADAFAFSQGEVWVHNQNDFSLYVYALGSDGKLTPQGSYAGSFADSPALLTQGDDALVIQYDGLADGGLIIPVQHQSGGTFTHGTPMGVEYPLGAQWAPGVGVTVGSASQICSFSLGTGETADGGTCVSNLAVIGFDDDGVWWTDPASTQFDTVAVHVMGWRAGQTQVATGTLSQLTISTPNPISSLFAPQASPWLFGGATMAGTNPTELYLPKFDGSDVTLERYPFITETIHADSKRLWFAGTDTITWYAR